MGVMVPWWPMYAGVNTDGITSNQPASESINQIHFVGGGQPVWNGYLNFAADLRVFAFVVGLDSIPQAGTVRQFRGRAFRQIQRQGVNLPFSRVVKGLPCALIGDS